MKFSVWYDFRNPIPWRRPYNQLYRDLLDQIEWLDQLQVFEHIWLSEHHFTDDGYLPAIVPMMAAISERTEYTRVGSQVLIAPLHHPLRIAEDVAVIDQLSRGRVSLGLAPGYLTREFDVLDVPREERGSRTSETIQILKEAWRGKPFSHEGRHFNFSDVVVTPPPFQSPHPPIWVGGSSPASARRAGRFGCHFMADEGTPVETIRLFRETLDEFGYDGRHSRVSTNRMVYVCEESKAGWNDVGEHLLYVHNQYREWYAEAGELEHMGPPVSRVRDLPRDMNIVGTPEYVVDQIVRQTADLSIDSLAFWACPPGLAVEKSSRSLQLFAESVVPALSG